MTTTGKRVAIGMSGGVDSSTSAFLLQQQGYDVVGLSAMVIKEGGKCCEKAAREAEKVCNHLGIEFYTVDLKSIFEDRVINYFLNTYKTGKTPNPCVVCNKNIKWGAMADYAFNELGCDYLATGHYAKIEKSGNIYKLKRPVDKQKDQTYMLVNLTQDDLARTIFPVGDFEKSEVKKMARENGIPTANNEESQDVCFIIEPDNVQEYLERHFGQNPGKIIDCSTGEIIGEHTGVYRFTIGQRRGIRVAYPYPLYVVSIDTENNNIYVGAREDIESNNLIATDINWIEGAPSEDVFYALTKIRYNSPAKLASIEVIDEKSVNVSFDETVYAVTPGQVAAFYSLDNNYLLGGGWIQ